MTKKDMVESVVKEYSAKLVKAFKLDCLYIDIHVLSSKSKIGRKIHEEDPCVACCERHVYIKNGFQLIIFYDKQKDAQYALESLIHELLHIKLFDLVEMISAKKMPYARKLEEKIVQDLERMLGALLT